MLRSTNAPHHTRCRQVFGRVVSGLEVLRRVEALAGSGSGKPAAPVAITACGAWRGAWAPSDPSLAAPQPGQGWCVSSNPACYPPADTSSLFAVLAPRALALH